MVLWLVFSSILIAQQVPQGMKYQAVARNLKGDILANEKISLRISLNSMKNGVSTTHYSERHDLNTNEVGLFTLVIGEGKSENVKFTDIPWSTEDIWMQVSIGGQGKGGFTDISYSKLMTVPYAFHAETANRISTNTNTNGNKEAAPSPPSVTWTTKGNSGTVPPGDYLGTSDNKSIIIKTNGIERMNIENTGNVNIKGNVNLNSTAGGATVNNGNFTVSNLSASNLTGSLSVGKKVTFMDGTQSTTKDIGALVVEGGVGIEKNLNVGGDFDVAGASTLKNLTVESINSKSINITDNAKGYMATFINTNADNGADAGDGIKIQLGRTHALHPSFGTSAFTLPSVDGNPMPNTTAAAQNYFDNLRIEKGQFKADELLEDIGVGVGDDMEEFGQFMLSKLVDVTNIVIVKVNEGIGEVNDALNLPLDITKTINDGLDLPNNIGKKISDGLNLPYKILDETIIPAINGPTIPKIETEIILPAIPSIPTIPPIDPGPFNVNINFTFPWDAVSNPLSNDNEFIGFFDKNGTKSGAIRGQSIGEWFTNYFDVPWFVNLAATVLTNTDEDAGTVGPLSFVKYGVKGFAMALEFGYEFSQMGIEYSSGNGDYAEWLERADSKEQISYGDIVAVKGGKITKDLTGAEQIMAVSQRPIVLGNVPEKAKYNLGNNIAFMGQIPVKVMGPVKAGDYIVAKSGISGYGIGIDPSQMNVDDYKLAVGRSWTTNEKSGPKMINTVVGVHNNGFLQIIKELQEKTDSNNNRLKAIENKLNISQSIEKQETKKPFK